MAPPYVCTGNKGSLYDQFHTNVEGSGQLVENADVFDRLATEYNQHKFALKDALNAIKVTYTGQAAESMQGAFEPLIESVGQGYDLCRRSAVLLTDQGGGFDTTQSAIKKPVDVPSKPWLNGLTPWDTGYDKAVEQNSHIDSANQQAFFRYAMTSLGNSGAAPTFESGTAGLGAITVTEGQQVNLDDPNQVVDDRHRPGGGDLSRPNPDPGRTPGLQPLPSQPPSSQPPPPPPPPPPGHGGDVPSGGVPVLPGGGHPSGTDSQGFVPPSSGGGVGPQIPVSGPGPSGFGSGGGSVGVGPVGGFVPGVGGYSGGGPGGGGSGSVPRGPGGVRA